jgi:hypothetical protein
LSADDEQPEVDVTQISNAFGSDLGQSEDERKAYFDNPTITRPFVRKAKRWRLSLS